ncbi:E3 binding domain-containing protein [Larsenimonas suaedae]|uniref:E3 binding domain-containing protein n=1 Tax=Larsenimonas suaedae TaxID=1851019 RepID=A0ABU1GXW6_9GAMM|nr:E3 binding domain-containing protein [Larsenimonas suaedae]MCM2972792.1 E3 binding domain-containing protein [Larsenimonas suaedae]MDR5896891.1 E3 binding domain-containing protein [Larsenimonas suaedae]
MLTDDVDTFTPVAHAAPKVRRYARELGVPLARVHASGPRGRILIRDVQAFVRQTLDLSGVHSEERE